MNFDGPHFQNDYKEEINVSAEKDVERFKVANIANSTQLFCKSFYFSVLPENFRLEFSSPIKFVMFSAEIFARFGHRQRRYLIS